tara:strand:- start:1442 stop:1660 length:219 start_codon:yes stop_codon:yes gene_type:complete
MPDKKLTKIIGYIRESMSVGADGFTGKSDPKGPTAGYDPVMKKKPMKRYASGGRGSRKNWLDYLRKKDGRAS